MKKTIMIFISVLILLCSTVSAIYQEPLDFKSPPERKEVLKQVNIRASGIEAITGDLVVKIYESPPASYTAHGYNPKRSARKGKDSPVRALFKAKDYSEYRKCLSEQKGPTMREALTKTPTGKISYTSKVPDYAEDSVPSEIHSIEAKEEPNMALGSVVRVIGVGMELGVKKESVSLPKKYVDTGSMAKGKIYSRGSAEPQLNVVKKPKISGAFEVKQEKVEVPPIPSVEQFNVGLSPKGPLAKQIIYGRPTDEPLTIIKLTPAEKAEIDRIEKIVLAKRALKK